jgi:hypothetical protein
MRAFARSSRPSGTIDGSTATAAPSAALSSTPTTAITA